MSELWGTAGVERKERGGIMERLTTDKPVKEMRMYELAHNCMFNRDGEAWYRDFDREVSLRNMVRGLYRAYCLKYDEQIEDDEYLDSMLFDDLQIPIEEDFYGLIALFNMLAWSHAELRETLMQYEDLEEDGKLLKLPCKPGDTVYEIIADDDPYIAEYEVQDISTKSVKYCGDWIDLETENLYFSEREAQKALEEMK